VRLIHFVRFAVFLWLVALSGPAMAANPLIVDGARPQRIAVMAPGTLWSESLLAQPPMLRRLRGVMAILEGASIAEFFRAISLRRPAVGQAPPPIEGSGTEPLYDLYLSGRRSKSFVQVRGNGVGDAELVGAENYSAAIDLVALRAVMGVDGLYAGGFEKPDAAELGTAPRLVSTTRFVTLDTPTLRDRLYRTIPSMTRPSEIRPRGAALAARLPRLMSVKDPPGLVVWITPSDGWAVPTELHNALDEKGLICIGALSSGNERFVNDRMQLALDAVGTALARWPIDTRRIYVTGMSGGAKMAVQLWAGWPELFAGSIPIVGMASHLSASAGPGRVYPALFSEPKPGRLEPVRRDRLAAMTGPLDFNYDSMVKMIRGLEVEHFAVRLFEYPDMGHVMPTPERFAEALSWIDEPYQDLRRGERAAADAAMSRYQSTFGDRSPRNDAERKALEEIMRVGPWTEAAWKAWEWLHESESSAPG